MPDPTTASREGRPAVHRRRHGAPEPDRARLLDRELLPPLWDTGSGRRFRRLGLPEPHHALRISAPALRVPLGGLHGQPLSDGGGLSRRSTTASERLDPGEPEERNIYEAMEAGKRSRSCRCRSARRWTRGRRGRQADAGRDVPVFTHYKGDEWEKFIHGHRVGPQTYWTACPNRSAAIKGDEEYVRHRRADPSRQALGHRGS